MNTSTQAARIPTFTKSEAVKKTGLKIVTTFSYRNFALRGSINDL
jgi:hypothetical protein